MSNIPWITVAKQHLISIMEPFVSDFMTSGKPIEPLTPHTRRPSTAVRAASVSVVLCFAYGTQSTDRL